MVGKQQPVAIMIVLKGYGAQVTMGILKYAREHRHWDVNRIVDCYDRTALAAIAPRGIIGQFASAAPLELAKSFRIPIVNVSQVMDTEFPLVTMDNLAIGRMAAEHLLSRGYRDLHCLAWSGTRYAQLRVQGFTEAARARGIRCEVHELPKLLDEAPDQLSKTRKMSEWLRKLPSPAGIFISASIYGIATIGPAAKQAGKRIPQDAGFVVMGEEPIACEAETPSLTTVDCPGERVGYEAARLLDQLMQGQRAPERPKLVPPLGITERASTNAFVLDDPDVVAALEFIRKHACRGATVQHVTAAIPLSPRTLQRRFQELTGHTLQEELVRTRIEQAKYLLAETDLSPSLVARRSGMTSVSLLCHNFRSYVGISPSKYRAKFRSSD